MTEVIDYWKLIKDLEKRVQILEQYIEDQRFKELLKDEPYVRGYND